MKGYLTVFLSLTLGILTTFVMVLIGHAVQNGCKVRLECVTDIGMNSTLGEYQIALFERYGLLYIDTSYETQEPSVSNLERRLHFYLSQNTKEEANSPWGSLAVQEVSVYDAVTAAYGYGNSMKYQAMQVAKETKGKMGAWADFKRIDEIAGLDGSNMFDEWGALMAQIAEMELPQILNEKGEWEIVPLANPADGIYALAGGDILYQAGIRAEGISATRIQKSDYISERAEDTLLRFGRIGIKETDTDLFLSYLFDKMGNYGRLHKESLLDLQLEYVAMGKASDYDNLRAVVGKLFLWRFAANADAVFGNAGLHS